MHEVSLICSAMEEVEYHCLRNNINKVSKILLGIGKFAAVDYSALEFAFESIAKDTICDGAVLEIKEIIPMAYCDLCEKRYEVSFTNKSCPSCGLASGNITEGYEVLLERIEGE